MDRSKSADVRPGTAATDASEIHAHATRHMGDHEASGSKGLYSSPPSKGCMERTIYAIGCVLLAGNLFLFPLLITGSFWLVSPERDGFFNEVCLVETSTGLGSVCRDDAIAYTEFGAAPSGRNTSCASQLDLCSLAPNGTCTGAGGVSCTDAVRLVTPADGSGNVTACVTTAAADTVCLVDLIYTLRAEVDPDQGGNLTQYFLGLDGSARRTAINPDIPQDGDLATEMSAEATAAEICAYLEPLEGQATQCWISHDINAEGLPETFSFSPYYKDGERDHDPKGWGIAFIVFICLGTICLCACLFWACGCDINRFGDHDDDDGGAL